jgi:C-3',4' desaturase CrtD
VLSRHLEEALVRDGGRLLLRHRVTALQRQNGRWQVEGNALKDRPFRLEAQDVICSLPPQCLPDLIPSRQWPTGYSKRLKALPEPSGALVFYGAIRREALPDACPGHLQRGSEHPGSLFISVSRAGDGRAPDGEATVIASVFTPTADWCRLAEPAYQRRKQEALQSIRSELERALQIQGDGWLHAELATPRGFAGWTGRPRGMVGGLGQHPSRFGPFGLAGRTPFQGLWLCGDSLHPGEGTAGVSLSALNACRQLMAERGQRLVIKD